MSSYIGRQTLRPNVIIPVDPDGGYRCRGRSSGRFCSDSYRDVFSTSGSQDRALPLSTTFMLVGLAIFRRDFFL